MRARVIKLVFDNNEVIGTPYPKQVEKMGTSYESSYLSELVNMGNQGWKMVADFRLQQVFCEKMVTDSAGKPQRDEKGKIKTEAPFFSVPMASARYIQYAEMPPYDEPPPPKQGGQQGRR